MKKLVAITVLTLPLLTGCALFDFFKKPEPHVPLPEKTISVDPKLLQLCKPLSRIEEGADLGVEYVILLGKYGECALQQSASVKALRRIAEGN